MSRVEFFYEFSDVPGSRTRVRVTVTRYKEGVPWWERLLPPNDWRRHLRWHLKDTIAKCEHDLGTRRSAKRWFAVY
jgi:hypothetical protein